MTSKWAAACLVLAVVYFSYHAFAGEQGLGKWSDTQMRLAEKRAELDALLAENAALQNDIARLMPGQVDPDLVEVLARAELGFVYNNELIVTDE